jgi:hypothetical protein
MRAGLLRLAMGAVPRPGGGGETLATAGPERGEHHDRRYG